MLKNAICDMIDTKPSPLHAAFILLQLSLRQIGGCGTGWSGYPAVLGLFCDDTHCVWFA